jgi:Asp-tRNA(Asn)/Glu-tRNA(Gln) amidotransferase A subunit family amidase
MFDQPRYDSGAAGRAFRLIIASNILASVERYALVVNRSPEDGELERVNAQLIEEAKRSSAADLVNAIHEVHKVGRAVGHFFENYDILLTPTVAAPPVRLGVLDITSDDVESYLKAVFSWIPYTAVANQAGIPSMSVPLNWNTEGLPIGSCLTAGYGKDALLFRLASQLESARPWVELYPELSR